MDRAKKKSLPSKAALIDALSNGVDLYAGLIGGKSVASKASRDSQNVFKGPEYRSRSTWSAKSQAMEESMRCFIYQDGRPGHLSSSASALPFSVPEWTSQSLFDNEAPIGICSSILAFRDENKTRSMLRFDSHYSYDTCGFRIRKDRWMFTDIESMIVEYIRRGNAQYMSKNKDSANELGLVEHDTSFVNNKTNFTGVLKALTVQGRCHMRPLSTAGDLRIALTEMCENGIFDIAVIQIPTYYPHSQHKTIPRVFYRYYFQQDNLNTPECVIKFSVKQDLEEEWGNITGVTDKRLSADKDKQWQRLKEHFDPSLNAKVFDKQTIHRSQVSPKLLTICRQCVQMIQRQLPANRLLNECILDFDVCFQEKEHIIGEGNMPGEINYDELLLEQRTAVEALYNYRTTNVIAAPKPPPSGPSGRPGGMSSKKVNNARHVVTPLLLKASGEGKSSKNASLKLQGHKPNYVEVEQDDSLAVFYRLHSIVKADVLEDSVSRRQAKIRTLDTDKQLFLQYFSRAFELAFQQMYAKDRKPVSTAVIPNVTDDDQNDQNDISGNISGNTNTQQVRFELSGVIEGEEGEDEQRNADTDVDGEVSSRQPRLRKMGSAMQQKLSEIATVEALKAVQSIWGEFDKSNSSNTDQKDVDRNVDNNTNGAMDAMEMGIQLWEEKYDSFLQSALDDVPPEVDVNTNSNMQRNDLHGLSIPEEEVLSNVAPSKKYKRDLNTYRNSSLRDSIQDAFDRKDEKVAAQLKEKQLLANKENEQKIDIELNIMATVMSRIMNKYDKVVSKGEEEEKETLMRRRINAFRTYQQRQSSDNEREEAKEKEEKEEVEDVKKEEGKKEVDVDIEEHVQGASDTAPNTKEKEGEKEKVEAVMNLDSNVSNSKAVASTSKHMMVQDAVRCQEDVQERYLNNNNDGITSSAVAADALTLSIVEGIDEEKEGDVEVGEEGGDDTTERASKRVARSGVGGVRVSKEIIEKKAPEFLLFLKLWERSQKKKKKKKKSSKKSGGKRDKDKYPMKVYRHPDTNEANIRSVLEYESMNDFREYVAQEEHDLIYRKLKQNLIPLGSDIDPYEAKQNEYKLGAGTRKNVVVADNPMTTQPLSVEEAAAKAAVALSVTDILLDKAHPTVKGLVDEREQQIVEEKAELEFKAREEKLRLAEEAALEANEAVINKGSNGSDSSGMGIICVSNPLEVVSKSSKNASINDMEEAPKKRVLQLVNPTADMQTMFDLDKEDKTQRREEDPDWPDFRERMDDKFFPYVSFEDREEDEKESNLILEMLLSLMPFDYAVKIRTAITRKAKSIREKRRKHLMKQKRKFVTRDEELAEYDLANFFDDEVEDDFDLLDQARKFITLAPEEPPAVYKAKPAPEATPAPLGIRQIKKFLRKLVHFEIRKVILDGDLIDEEERLRLEEEERNRLERMRFLAEKAALMGKGVATAAVDACMRLDITAGSPFWTRKEIEAMDTKVDKEDKNGEEGDNDEGIFRFAVPSIETPSHSTDQLHSESKEREEDYTPYTSKQYLSRGRRDLIDSLTGVTTPLKREVKIAIRGYLETLSGKHIYNKDKDTGKGDDSLSLHGRNNRIGSRMNGNLKGNIVKNRMKYVKDGDEEDQKVSLPKVAVVSRPPPADIITFNPIEQSITGEEVSLNKQSNASRLNKTIKKGGRNGHDNNNNTNTTSGKGLLLVPGYGTGSKRMSKPFQYLQQYPNNNTRPVQPSKKTGGNSAFGSSSHSGRGERKSSSYVHQGRTVIQVNSHFRSDKKRMEKDVFSNLLCGPFVPSIAREESYSADNLLSNNNDYKYNQAFEDSHAHQQYAQALIMDDSTAGDGYMNRENSWDGSTERMDTSPVNTPLPPLPQGMIDNNNVGDGNLPPTYEMFRIDPSEAAIPHILKEYPFLGDMSASIASKLSEVEGHVHSQSPPMTLQEGSADSISSIVLQQRILMDEERLKSEHPYEYEEEVKRRLNQNQTMQQEQERSVAQEKEVATSHHTAKFSEQFHEGVFNQVISTHITNEALVRVEREEEAARREIPSGVKDYTQDTHFTLPVAVMEPLEEDALLLLDDAGVYNDAGITITDAITDTETLIQDSVVEEEAELRSLGSTWSTKAVLSLPLTDEAEKAQERRRERKVVREIRKEMRVLLDEYCMAVEEIVQAPPDGGHHDADAATASIDVSETEEALPKKGGMLSYAPKKEKPKHPPVFGASRRLYNPADIAAVRQQYKESTTLEHVPSMSEAYSQWHYTYTGTGELEETLPRDVSSLLTSIEENKDSVAAKEREREQNRLLNTHSKNNARSRSSTNNNAAVHTPALSDGNAKKPSISVVVQTTKKEVQLTEPDVTATTSGQSTALAALPLALEGHHTAIKSKGNNYNKATMLTNEECKEKTLAAVVDTSIEKQKPIVDAPLSPSMAEVKDTAASLIHASINEVLNLHHAYEESINPSFSKAVGDGRDSEGESVIDIVRENARTAALSPDTIETGEAGEYGKSTNVTEDSTVEIPAYVLEHLEDGRTITHTAADFMSKDLDQQSKLRAIKLSKKRQGLGYDHPPYNEFQYNYGPVSVSSSANSMMGIPSLNFTHANTASNNSIQLHMRVSGSAAKIEQAENKEFREKEEAKLEKRKEEKERLQREEEEKEEAQRLEEDQRAAQKFVLEGEDDDDLMSLTNTELMTLQASSAPMMIKVQHKRAPLPMSTNPPSPFDKPPKKKISPSKDSLSSKDKESSKRSPQKKASSSRKSSTITNESTGSTAGTNTKRWGKSPTVVANVSPKKDPTIKLEVSRKDNDAAYGSLDKSKQQATNESNNESGLTPFVSPIGIQKYNFLVDDKFNLSQTLPAPTSAATNDNKDDRNDKTSALFLAREKKDTPVLTIDTSDSTKTALSVRLESPPMESTTEAVQNTLDAISAATPVPMLDALVPSSEKSSRKSQVPAPSKYYVSSTPASNVNTGVIVGTPHKESKPLMLYKGVELGEELARTIDVLRLQREMKDKQKQKHVYSSKVRSEATGDHITIVGDLSNVEYDKGLTSLLKNTDGMDEETKKELEEEREIEEEIKRIKARDTSQGLSTKSIHIGEYATGRGSIDSTYMEAVDGEGEEKGEKQEDGDIAREQYTSFQDAVRAASPPSSPRFLNKSPAFGLNARVASTSPVQQEAAREDNKSPSNVEQTAEKSLLQGIKGSHTGPLPRETFFSEKEERREEKERRRGAKEKQAKQLEESAVTVKESKQQRGSLLIGGMSAKYSKRESEKT